MYDPTADPFLDARRPILLDLFCGAGGAAMGYYRAGFRTIVGVDIAPQPQYPFIFVQADALEYVERFGKWFDAVHASPPCQRYTALRSMWNWDATVHPDLIEPTRTALEQSRCPYVIENVPGAPLHAPILLCGTMFGLGISDSEGAWYDLRRHRLFESSLPLVDGLPHHHGCRTVGIYGAHIRDRRQHRKVSGAVARAGRNFTSDRHKIEVGRVILDVPHMRMWQEVVQAIPPAYTEYLGRQLLAHLRAA